MNELAMNLSAKRVDYRYLKLLIVGEAVVTKMPRKLLAVRDSFQVAFKDPDPVSHRNAIFHIEKELLHVLPLTPIRRVRNRSERDPAAISHF
jgi:hypothetical protein